MLPSPLPVMMAGVIPYPYRPEPDFYYLTGVVQPGCVAVVVAEEEGEHENGGEEEESGGLGGRRRKATATSAKKRRRQHRFILFVPDECPRTRLWDGGRLSVEAAKRVFGADEAFPMSQVRREGDFFFFEFFERKKNSPSISTSTLKKNSSTPASPRSSRQPPSSFATQIGAREQTLGIPL